MTYILNYNSIFNIRQKIPSRFGGSSKFKVINDELVEVRKDTRKLSDLEQVKGENSKKKKQEVKPFKAKQNAIRKKVYKLNKSKVKRKCIAFSRLEKSRQFLAFYSISFPLGLTDEAAYFVYNNWLTRCRKSSELKSYLWVAERQKNGTIHFHLLTNDFMPIQVVNGYMRSALKTAKRKGNETLTKVDIDKYNGVDVQRVGREKGGVISYLVKYISKNDIEFYRLPWHCSRDVSRLFTSTYFEVPEGENYLDLLPESMEKYTPEKTDEINFVGVGFKFKPDERLFEDIDTVNELVYQTKGKS